MMTKHDPRNTIQGPTRSPALAALLAERPTPFTARCLLPATGRTSRRRGNVLILVLTILFIAFSFTVAMLALFRTGNKLIGAEQQKGEIDAVVDSVTDELLVTSASQLKGYPEQLPTGVGTAAQFNLPYTQRYNDSDTDSLPDNPDLMDQFVLIPGVNPLLSVIEPYNSNASGGTTPELDLEWFAVTDLYRLLDYRTDVAFRNPDGIPGNADDYQPRLPAGFPLRIQALPILPISERNETNGNRRDADGDGVIDSFEFHLGLVPNGEADWGTTAGPSNSDDDGSGAPPYDIACDGVIDAAAAALTGPASFTGGFATAWPCDDKDNNGVLLLGTGYPQALRRPVAALLKDPDTLQGADPADDLFLAMKVISNNGMVNLNSSHWTLVDNLFGLDAAGTARTSALMVSRPYAPQSHERWLRRRGFLPPRDLPTSLAIGRDMTSDPSWVPATSTGDLKDTLLDAMFTDAAPVPWNTGFQWYPLADNPPVGDEPGAGLVFDTEWFRWMNPFDWNDRWDSMGFNGASGGGELALEYDIRHLLTTVSSDDQLIRNSYYDPDGAGTSGPGSDPVLLTDFLTTLNAGADVTDMPALKFTIPDLGPPGFSPEDWQDNVSNPYQNNLSSDSAMLMYPGHDPNYAAVLPAVADLSFIDTAPGGTGLPKVPLALTNAWGGGRYGVPRDPVTGLPTDIRFGNLQFWLHSIGNINNPTQREKQTVLDYFTVMLRNIHDFNQDSILNAQDDNAIHDAAAQLTVNLIDFADYDGGLSGMADYPTELLSRESSGSKVYYGFENQPFISEIFQDGSVYGVEIFNPYSRDFVGLQTLGYKLRVLDGAGNPVYNLPTDVALPAGDYHYYASDHMSGTLTPVLAKGETIAALTFSPGNTVQLIRTVPSAIHPPVVDIVVDEFLVETPNLATNSLQRDTTSAGGWLASVPVDGLVGGPPLPYEGATGFGNTNVVVLTNPYIPAVAPVHALTDSSGLASAYPNVGSLLMIMRYAHLGDIVNDPSPRSMTYQLKAKRNAVDNGHMPVFDQLEVAQKDWQGVAGAQPLDGTTLLNIPWGQLVYDYFTVLPFENTFNPTAIANFNAPCEPGNTVDGGAFGGPDTDGDDIAPEYDQGYSAYLTWLHANQPTVRENGLIVEGRININSAPWKVLEGLPMLKPGQLPIYKDILYGPVGGVAWAPGTWTAYPDFDGSATNNETPDLTAAWPIANPSIVIAPTADVATNVPLEQMLQPKAQSIVAYRELRSDMFDGIGTRVSTGNYNVLNGGVRLRNDSGPLVSAVNNQRHTAGFLTVGELANVRTPQDGTGTPVADNFQMDNGQAYGETGDGIGYENRNYLYAIAPLVALNDAWVTVKGHTFTTYGVLRGAGSKDAVDGQAVRFEMVFDRSNLLESTDPGERPITIYRHSEPFFRRNPE
ncbi:MAG: hypothetical protein HJJLKODD_01945 [Phycisphaerae bacterium]|nr:hypothetical protein [Phycisphaerae bacterium]